MPKAGGSTKPRLTRENLHKTVEPANNCPVKQFLDGLDAEDREVLEEAIALDSRRFPAPKILTFLKECGYGAADIPFTADQVKAHRAKRSPCRCR